MGVAPLLLGLSRRDGRDHGSHDRLHRGQRRALADERGRTRPGFHGASRDHFLIRGRVDRLSGRERIDQRQHRDQCDPNRRAAVLCGVGDRVPPGTSRRFDGYGAGRHLEGVALLPDRRYARSSVWVVSNTAAQLQLDDAAGDDRNPAAGWFRISHLARGRGAQPEEGHPPRGAPVTHYPVPVLLPDRILRRELLPEQCLQPCGCERLGRTDRRHAGDSGQCTVWAGTVRLSCCWKH